MSWLWKVDKTLSASQREELGLDLAFPTQGEAESWIGENYPDLVNAGLSQVTLYEEDRLVYGPMSLHPPA